MRAGVSDASEQGRGNRVLAALPDPVYRRCMQDLQPTELALRQVLFEYDQPIPEVYFPLTSIGSLLIPLAHGSTVEVATVGNEGVVGLPVFLGAHSLPMRAVNQVPGRALSMDVEVFRQLLADTDGPFAGVLQRYTQTLFVQIAQNAACNRTHSIEQRAARWLLMTADRAGSPTFLLTHDFLAQMLGVRRASVTEAAGALATLGAITYTRGQVTVLDRNRLEQASCECYSTTRTVLERMLPDPATAAR